MRDDGREVQSTVLMSMNKDLEVGTVPLPGR
jgi:hypothetical protein